MTSKTNTGNKPRTKPTMKQKQFATAYILNQGNGLQAVKKVYNAKSDSTAQTMASENLTKPLVKREIERQLRSTGIDEASISKALMLYLSKAVSPEVLDRVGPEHGLKTIRMASEMMDLFPASKIHKLTYEVKTTLLKETPKQLKDRLIELRKEEDRFNSVTE